MDHKKEPRTQENEQSKRLRRRRRRRLPFKLDLLPGLRSRKWAEEHTDWEKFEWNDSLEEEAPWRVRLLFAGGALVTVAVLGGAAWFFLREAGRDLAMAKGEGAGAVEVEGAAGAELGEELESEVDAVKRVVSEFVAAETVHARKRLVVQSDGVGVKMADHYRRHPLRTGHIYDFPVIALRMPKEGNHYIVQALTADGERLNFAVLPGGREPRIAWEAHVGYCEIDWDVYLEERPAEAKEMRVYVEVSDYYPAPFEEGAGYLSVAFTRPGSSRSLHGFVSKTETVGVGGFARVLLAGGRKPAVVRLRFAEGQADAERPVALVEEFLGEGWFRPEPD